MPGLTLLALCSVLLISCATQQKKEDRSYRFFRENPAKLATLCADQYPVKDSISPGKEIVTHDTVKVAGIVIPCPQPTINPGTGKTEPGSVQCPPAKTITNTITKRDTIFQENTARIADLLYKLEIEKDLHKKFELKADENQESTNKWRLFAIAASVGLIGFTILKFRKLLPF